jgi:exodeoxyribonuclease VII large subunit
MNAPLPASSQFADVSPGTLQQFTTLLLERLAASELPELGGMIRLHGRWTDPGRASGKSYYGAKIVDDGGSQAKVEILASLVASRGVLPGHLVIATGRLAVRSTNYGLEVRLVATDIELGDQEQAAKTEVAQQGRMTIERLRSIPMRRVPFPDRDSVSVTLIHSNSAAAQVTQDCMAELSKLGDSVGVFPVKVNMLDPVAIATAIRDANSDDIVMIIRGGGDAADFEVFDDPRVVTALSSQQAHRVVGLGHTGNATLLDLFCDFSANTPAQAGAYVRERVQQRQRLLGDAGKDLRLAKERMEALEKERNTAQAQLQTASELLAKAKGGVPAWAVAVAFAVGAILAYLIRG